MKIPNKAQECIRMSTRNPWKTLSSQLVYENAWIRVREDQVLRPNGKPGIYSVVEKPISVGTVDMHSE